MAHLSSHSSALASFSLVCRDWAHVADEYVRELYAVPLGGVARALARFDRATALLLDTDRAPGCEIRAALAAVPREHAGRIEHLTLHGFDSITADELAGAFRPAGGGKGPAWGALRELELCDGQLELCSDGLARLAARLPALDDLSLVRTRRSPRAWDGDVTLFARLRSLELADVDETFVISLMAWMAENRPAQQHGGARRRGQGQQPSPQPPQLRHLVVSHIKASTDFVQWPGGETVNMVWMLELEGLPALEELEVRRAPRLYAFNGLGRLSALTRLVLQDAPLAGQFDHDGGEELLGDLARLTQLRDLRLCRAPLGLHRMPSALSALTALTNLELGMRLRDHDGDGPEPEDLAPLGRGAPAALGTDPAALTAAGVGHGPLMCFGLRRLVVRGFRGPLHLPEGLERFTALEELDLGGRQTVANLGPWLLRMPALRCVTVPARSAAQSVFEALELRNDPHQVEVIEDPDGPTFSDSDSDAISEDDDEEDEDEDDEDEYGSWEEDGEPWAGEGF
jgi:hypothetical protein